MRKIKLSDFKRSIETGYLPVEWRQKVSDSSDFLFTESGYLILKEDSTVTNQGDVFHTDIECDEFVYSKYYGECLTYGDNIVYAYVNRRYQDYIYSRESIHLNNEYYLDESSVLVECGFIQTEDEGWIDEDSAFYHESDGCYYSYPEEEEEEEYVFSYHSGFRKNYAVDSEFRIGFEVEKEDEDIRNEDLASDIFRETGWAKELDGSLDSSKGFELVSPVYPLFDFDFKTEFQKVKKFINADFSSSCGGHINFSIKDKTPKEMLDAISGYLPLIYSIYNHRIGNTYCKAKKKENIILDNEKYQAVCLKPNYIEFRIFPVVKNIDNLLWRVELFQIMAKNQETDGLKIIENMVDSTNVLHAHLLKVFTKERLIDKVKLAIRHLSEIEQIQIPSLAISEISKKSNQILNS